MSPTHISCSRSISIIFCLVSSHKALQKSTHLSAIFIHVIRIDDFQYVYILSHFWGFVKPRTLRFWSSSWPQISYADVVEEGGATLGRLRVVSPEEDGHGRTSGGDCFLGMHPSIFGHFVPGKPLHAGCLMVLSTAEVNPQGELHRRGALDMFAPGRDSVAMARGDGNGAVDTRRGSSEIKGQLLRTLPTMDISRVLVPVDTMDKRSLPSALALCCKGLSTKQPPC